MTNTPTTPPPEGSTQAAGLILLQRMKCPKCSWTGTVHECEPDVDGDGSLGCPRCKTVAESNNKVTDPPPASGGIGVTQPDRGGGSVD